VSTPWRETDSIPWAKVCTIDGIHQAETMSILKVHKLRYTSPAIG